MKNPIVIAVDAMGGDNSPKKIIEGIELYHHKNKNIYFKLFGDKNQIENSLQNKKIDKNNFIKFALSPIAKLIKIINTKSIKIM